MNQHPPVPPAIVTPTPVLEPVKYAPTLKEKWDTSLDAIRQVPDGDDVRSRTLEHLIMEQEADRQSSTVEPDPGLLSETHVGDLDDLDEDEVDAGVRRLSDARVDEEAAQLIREEDYLNDDGN